MAAGDEMCVTKASQDRPAGACLAGEGAAGGDGLLREEARRLVALEGDVGSPRGQKALWTLAESILPERDCGQFNQALMELGSLVCTPRDPQCPTCPVCRLCAARAEGRQLEIPAARAKPRTEAVREAAVVVWRDGRMLLRQCGPGERWAGMWDFVRFPLTRRGRSAIDRELVQSVYERAGLAIESLARITTIKHGVTRYRITLDCYQAEYKFGQPRAPARWIRLAQLAELPLSTTGRKLAQLVRHEENSAKKHAADTVK